MFVTRPSLLSIAFILAIIAPRLTAAADDHRYPVRPSNNLANEASCLRSHAWCLDPHANPRVRAIRCEQCVYSCSRCILTRHDCIDHLHACWAPCVHFKRCGNDRKHTDVENDDDVDDDDD